MPTPMTAEEQELRLRLDEAVRRIRSTLNRCPFVDELDYLDEADVEAAAALADEANRSLLEALSCTEALEQLRGAATDAALLCATSRTALGVVREVLTVLVAAVDCRRAA
jgi:hypothetical protein